MASRLAPRLVPPLQYKKVQKYKSPQLSSLSEDYSPILSLTLPSLPSLPAIRGQLRYLLYYTHTQNILVQPSTLSTPLPFHNLPYSLQYISQPFIKPKLSSLIPRFPPFLGLILILAALPLHPTPLILKLGPIAPRYPFHLHPRSISTALLPPPPTLLLYLPLLRISTSPANSRRRPFV